MPPEQRAGAAAHPSMDAHALGATLREIALQAEGAVPDPLAKIAAACLRTEPSARPDLARIAAALAESRARG
jgi:hypothetical protein